MESATIKTAGESYTALQSTSLVWDQYVHSGLKFQFSSHFIVSLNAYYTWVIQIQSRGLLLYLKMIIIGTLGSILGIQLSWKSSKFLPNHHPALPNLFTLLLVWGLGCIYGVFKLTGRCLEGVRKVSGRCREARFLKVCRYDQLRRNSCYDQLCHNSCYNQLRRNSCYDDGCNSHWTRLSWL